MFWGNIWEVVRFREETHTQVGWEHVAHLSAGGAQPCGPSAAGGPAAVGGPSGSSAVAGCSSGFGRSDTMDGANAPSGKMSRLYGKIPLDLNPEVMLRGVTAEMKASFTSPAIW